MKGVSCVLVVFGVGVLIGGVGGGVVLGGLVGIFSGVIYDLMVFGIESIVKGKDCLYGIFVSIN